ncbi:MAG: glucose-6-phosphate dehydrogenase, partial [Rhodoluna sp.]
RLVIRLQPQEGIKLEVMTKEPGPGGMRLRATGLDISFEETFNQRYPDAYERLILDVLLGDPPLFPRHEEVELSWKILDPIEEFWANKGKPEQYLPGSWGPASADAMLKRDGRAWRIP